MVSINPVIELETAMQIVENLLCGLKLKLPRWAKQVRCGQGESLFSAYERQQRSWNNTDAPRSFWYLYRKAAKKSEFCGCSLTSLVL